MVTLATIATSTAGNTAMTENRLTIWMCSLAAARPRRRACMTCQTSRTMMPTNTSMVAALSRMKETTTSRVGSIGVRPVSTTKVRQADRRARPTANGASNLHRDHPLDSANDGSNDAAEVSALVIPAKAELKGKLKAFRSPDQYRQQTDAFISQCCQIATIPRRALPPKYAFARPPRLTGRNRCIRDREVVNCRSGRPECPDRGSSSAACCG